MNKEIQPGVRVEVTRINGERRQGVVLCRVECLKHIGAFYLVGDKTPEEAPSPAPRGRPRKDRPKREKSPRFTPFGMYAPEEMKRLAGARMKI